MQQGAFGGVRSHAHSGRQSELQHDSVPSSKGINRLVEEGHLIAEIWRGDGLHVGEQYRPIRIQKRVREQLTAVSEVTMIEKVKS